MLLFHALFYSFHERRNEKKKKKIGKFISENRKRKGLTQEQLGNILGVSNKTISRWENGNYMPDLSLLIPLSETLDISLNELLNGKYITEDKIMETTEKSLKNTINYSKNMLVQEKRKILEMIS